jgi:serine phosphatase RsbU (regulator of sigma subunit)
MQRGSSDLLAAVPLVFEGVSVRVTDGAGQARVYGTPAADAAEVRVDLPTGGVVASVPATAAAAHKLVTSLLEVVAERERLESDMESMNAGALRLLEQVSMLGESLPRLSGASDDVEVASLGVRGCHRAAGVSRAIYLACVPGKQFCEVIVDFGGDHRPLGFSKDLDPLLPVDGLLAEILAAEGVVLRPVPRGGHLGTPGTVEYLATSQVLAVPVSYGAGDKRVVIGALVLLDREVGYGGVEGGEPSPLGSEEGQVAESFAAMIGAVLGARKVAALGKELSMAQAIQRQSLPERAVELSGFDVAARYFACGAVGGDYYDYVPLADGRTMAVVADVSGHNLASGMVMVGARAMLRALAPRHDGPHEVFDSLAAGLFDDLTRTERFLTAAAVALRADSGCVDYVSAGHNDLLVYRAATDRVESVASESTILGFLPEPRYESRTLQLEPGDCMLLYTDGITEATDGSDEMFGDERLAAVFAQIAPNRSASRIVDGIVQALDDFRRGQVGADDVTAVVIRCVAPGSRR